MRIDDENKVVYVNENLKDELFKLKKYNGISKLVVLQEFSGKFGLPMKLDDDKWKKISEVVFNNYTFKLEEQKYYWRKKKEHLAWFEEEVYLTRFKFSDNENYVYILGSKAGALKTISQEARDLLKHDFDKFEKVECE